MSSTGDQADDCGFDSDEVKQASNKKKSSKKDKNVHGDDNSEVFDNTNDIPKNSKKNPMFEGIDPSSAFITPAQFNLSRILHDGNCFEPRFGHAIAELDEVIYIYGGSNSSGKTYLQMITYDLKKRIFSKVPQSEKNPKICRDTALVAHNDRKKSQKILFLIAGENDVCEVSDDVWCFDCVGGKWDQLTPTGDIIERRKGHSCIISDKSGIIYLFGGLDSNNVTLNDVYTFTKDKWAKIHTTDEPKGRCHQSAVYYQNPSNGREYMIVFGGDLSGKCYATNELWILDLKTMRWRQIKDSTGSVPQQRFKHSATVIKDSMIVAGGFCNGWFSNYATSDFYIYDTLVNTWLKIVFGYELECRADFGGIARGSNSDTLYIFGGVDEEGKEHPDGFCIDVTITSSSFYMLETKFLSTDNHLMNLKKNYTELEKQMLEVISDTVLISGSVKQSNQKIKDLQSEFVQMKSSIDRMKSKIDESVMGIKSLTAEVEKLKELIPNLVGIADRVKASEDNIKEMSSALISKADKSDTLFMSKKISQLELNVDDLLEKK